MKKGIDRLVLALTVLFSAAGCIFCFLILPRLDADAWGRILWSGLFFSVPFAGSLLGSFLAETIQSHRFTVLRRRGRIMTLLIAAAAGFATGAAGQALYMISPSEKQADVDMVLLLDGSGSMEEKKEGCVTAAEALIGQMDENSRVQVASFAAAVLGNTDLLPMDEAGKQEVSEFIAGIDVIGGTEFGQPLSFALESLTSQQGEERKQAVILLSDGEGPLPDSLEKDYIDQGLVLYTIRIDSGSEETEDTKKLIRMAEATGGFDTLIAADENGAVDTEELTEAFASAFAATKELSAGDQMIVYGKPGDLPLIRFLIRTLVFAVYAVLAGAIYYRRLSAGQSIGNLAAGILLSVGVTVSGIVAEENPVPSCVLFCLLIFSAYTTYDHDEEADGYV